MTSALRISTLVEETIGRNGRDEVERFGVPIPRRALRSGALVSMRNPRDRALRTDSKALMCRIDGSIKRLAVHGRDSARRREPARYRVRTDERSQEGPEYSFPKKRSQGDFGYSIYTGAATFRVGSNGAIIKAAVVQSADLLDDAGAHLCLTGCTGHPYRPVTTQFFLDEGTPLRAAMVLEGYFAPASGAPVRFEFKVCLMSVVVNSAVSLEVSLHSLSAVSHPGGLWAFDDRGTAVFEKISFSQNSIRQIADIRWSLENARSVR